MPPKRTRSNASGSKPPTGCKPPAESEPPTGSKPSELTGSKGYVLIKERPDQTSAPRNRIHYEKEQTTKMMEQVRKDEIKAGRRRSANMVQLERHMTFLREMLKSRDPLTKEKIAHIEKRRKELKAAIEQGVPVRKSPRNASKALKEKEEGKITLKRPREEKKSTGSKKSKPAVAKNSEKENKDAEDDGAPESRAFDFSEVDDEVVPETKPKTHGKTLVKKEATPASRIDDAFLEEEIPEDVELEAQENDDDENANAVDAEGDDQAELGALLKVDEEGESEDDLVESENDMDFNPADDKIGENDMNEDEAEEKEKNVFGDEEELNAAFGY